MPGLKLMPSRLIRKKGKSNGSRSKVQDFGKKTSASSEIEFRKDRYFGFFGRWKLLLLIAMFFTAVLWWFGGNVCGLPLKYKVGQTDRRFEITEQEFLSAVRDAESWWESSTGRDLFSYDTESEHVLTFNLVYDDRQKATQEMQDIEGKRQELEQGLGGIIDEYEELKKIFNEREAALNEMDRIYERRLDEFRRKVDSWNEKGGAPPGVYDQLQRERAKLEELAREINSLIQEQKELANRINELAETETQDVESFNREVREFNEAFADEKGKEEEQGIYGSGTINVYQYDNRQDLVMLLAHEMGHALGLGHVDDPQAIMYYKKNERQETGQVHISEQSRRELNEVCNLH